ncbi:MAG: ATP-dependent Clp protease ATP-binding subunit, partial [Pyramidobacter sp.]|nr:ATP-dependent Clp protease ATP-binding subunit [Pyramidobacter sp.]
HIEKDAALERRFQPVSVSEPDQDAALKILHGLKDCYEKHHSVHYTDSALEAAVRLSSRYLADRSLPDKALDLIDEAGAKVRLDCGGSNGFDEMIVSEDQIADVLSEWSGIPVKTLTEAEAARYLRLETEIHRRLVGQNEAVSALCRAVRRSLSGLKDPNRPVGSFLFLGPSGVGKTELARCLARSLFGSEEALIALDMSEYMERHEVAKLIGAPPGYVGHEDGGRLTEAVRRRPWSVVLFDEVEKASPELFNILLQILEEGRLTDSHGRTTDFKNTIVIMTSNLGAREMGKSAFGFLPSGEAENKKRADAIREAVKSHFRPEFLNRLDAQLVFNPLTPQEMEQIFDVMMSGLCARLGERGIILSVAASARRQLLSAAAAVNQGARPLRRLIQTRIEDPLSDLLLSGAVQNGTTLDCTAGDGEKLQFSVRSRLSSRKRSVLKQLQP